jgi:hypothetical protein
VAVDSIRGFKGQNMRGRLPVSVVCANFPPGSYTFTAAKGGKYKFIAWGAGGGAGTAGAGTDTGGGSGGYAEITMFLATGQSVAVVVGVGGLFASGGNTTLTFPNGKVVTCTGGAAGAASSGGTAGTATGGDVNLAGSAGVTGGTGGSGLGTGGGVGGGGTGGGAGAPANLPFRGGVGTSAVSLNTPGPGAGGGATGTGGIGGNGQVLVFQSKVTA